MTDPQRKSQPRLPRAESPPSTEAETGSGLPRRKIPASSYREHLEREHGMTVVAERGWPTEYRRYFLVRGQNGTQTRLASHRGTFAQAVTHFYYLLHPEQRSRR